MTENDPTTTEETKKVDASLPMTGETGTVHAVDLGTEMQRSYLDYAMSVIAGRALPDARDGLKPVHRRVLWAMHESGVFYNRSHVKSARVVGDTMGKYHPHGDSAIYDALVRMAQDFSIRYLLIDGQGNFGSMDGDNAAAMRYTECRQAPIAAELLRDIEQDTVDFGPNYDEKEREPLVLPSRFPNLLVNGSSGIAVGMATNMAPHNLGEVIDATLAYMDDPTITTQGLMKFVKGPDFPTGAIIHGLSGVKRAEETGRGRIVMRARVNIEETKSGRSVLIVTELPYQVNKAVLVEKIAQIVKDKIVTEISALRDESDENVRIVIELKRDAIPQVVLNKLYKHTALQSSFGVNNIALDHGIPRLLGLRDLIKIYVEHQQEVEMRRTNFEKTKAENRAHILEGLLKALGKIDRVIEIIRGSETTALARETLRSEIGLSERQADAILDLRLARLTKISGEETQIEYDGLIAKIKELDEILNDEELLLNILREDLKRVRDRYADPRRTELTVGGDDIGIEDLIADDSILITMTHGGYIKRMDPAVLRAQARGGSGVSGVDLKDGDYIEHTFQASTHDYILMVTNLGKIYRIKGYDIPEGSRQSRGRALINLLPNLAADEEVRAVYKTRTYDEAEYIVFFTKQGLVKKTLFSAYDSRLAGSGIRALTLREDDELVGVMLANSGEDIMLVTQAGMSSRFSVDNVRAAGRTSSGVRGMKLKHAGDIVIGGLNAETGEVLLVTKLGYGKRVPLSDYPTKGRGGSGVITYKGLDKRGVLVAAVPITDQDDLVLITTGGQVVRTAASNLKPQGRATQGVGIMRLRKDHEIAGVAVLIAEDEDVNEGVAEGVAEEATAEEAVVESHEASEDGE